MTVLNRTIAICLFVALGVASPRARQVPEFLQTVNVTVLDGKSAAVPGLKTTDFTVTENGKARTIIKVEPSPHADVVVVVDDDGRGGSAVRLALAPFVAKLSSRARIAILTSRGGLVIHQQFTSDPAALAAAVDGLPQVTPTGNSFLPQALAELSQSFLADGVPRSVIVAITAPRFMVKTSEPAPDEETPATTSTSFEGGSLNPGSPRESAVQEALRRSRTMLFVVSLELEGSRSGNGQTRSVEVDQITWPNDVAAQSGGRLERFAASQRLLSALDQIANELLSQYAVTFSSPETSGTISLSVRTTRRGLTVRGPTRRN